MDIKIRVSEKAEQNIREQAEKNGKAPAEFIGEFVEETFTGKKTNGNEQSERSFMRLKGMFSSGKADTSERMHEILYSEDFDPAEGFSKQ